MAKIVDENALSAIVSDIKTALSGKANSDDVYPKSQTYNRTEIDNALGLKADKSELYNLYPTDQESGAIASFTDGADNIPVKSLVSEIVAVESGSGEKSPENPYTISGFDSGIVSVCGVNIWEESCKNGYYDVSTGNYVYNANQLCINDFIPVKPNTNYYCYKGAYSNQGECLFYDENKAFIGYLTPSNFNNKVFTTPNNCHYITFNLGNGYGTTYGNNISINYPSSDTSYHAYNGNTYTFAFGQTVYGGHFDNKGNLVVIRKAVIFNGSENWQPNGERGVFIFTSQIPDIDTTKPILFEEYETIATGQAPANDGQANYNSARTAIQIHDERGMTVANYKTFLASHNIKMLYYLATPITLAITSQDIPTLLGENNIFSNCGDVEVNYHADIGLYIDKKISSLAQA